MAVEAGVSKIEATTAHVAYTGTKNQSAAAASVVRCGEARSHSWSSTCQAQRAWAEARKDSRAGQTEQRGLVLCRASSTYPW